jgi:hypothetical protein
VSSDLDDDMLEAIGLSKVFSTIEGAEVRLEAINMEELNDTGIEMAAGNIILVMLQHFKGKKGAVSFVGKKSF